MMKIRALVLTGLLILLAAGILAGVSPQAVAIQGEEIRIGFIIPQAGPLGFLGRQQMIALDIAQEELAERGGIAGLKLKPIVYDSQSKPQEAINAARRLIGRDNVLAIIGPFLSGSAEVVFPIVNEAKIPILSPSSAKPGIPQKNRPWTFRNSIPTIKLYERIVAKWANEKNIKKVVIIYNNQDAIMRGDGEMVFPMLLKANGMTLSDSVSHGTGAFDFSAQVTRAMAQKPDGIIMSSYPEENGLLIREIRRQGFPGPVLGGIGFEQRALDKSRKEAEGVWATQAFWTGSPNPQVQRFVKEFVKRSERGVFPSQETAAFYDAIFILKKVIDEQGITNDPKQQQADREKVRKGLETLSDYPGISGKTTMGPDGDSIKEVVLLQVRKGEFVPLE